MERMSARAVVVASALAASAGCSLVVATDGLAGDSIEAKPEAGAMDGQVASDAPADDGGPGDADAGNADGNSVPWPVNGHRYEVRVYPTYKSWTEARDDAAASGGHLVTLTSAEEEGFVASLVRAREDAFIEGSGSWIGAYQPDPGNNEPGGGWAWVTGEPWSYVNWHASEPNDNNQDEHFVHYFEIGATLAWNDVDLEASGTIRSAVIEYE